MVNIKILSTGEIKQVHKNIAHDLIEKGLAKLSNTAPKEPDLVDSTQTTESVLEPTPKETKTESQSNNYNTRQMRSSENK